ncbi:hypothetical protein GHT06_015147 [Daphnia sinensis]|uniref:Transposase domain-containing protein n=1 Tax=Daphnia sinensis TaxID=1820382 RepID=A0AAD5PSN7_9CRUS|nr:hypothetical protein GHT06_015147 [Daphnia sinensis]
MSRQERRRVRAYVQYVNRLYDSSDESSDDDEAGDSSMGQSPEIVDMEEINLPAANVESDTSMSSDEDPKYFSTCSSLEDSTEIDSADEGFFGMVLAPVIPFVLRKNSLAADLRGWKTKFHVPLNQVGELLDILRKYHPELPKSAKTLLGTPRQKALVRNVDPGIYYHFGIEKRLLSILTSVGVLILDDPVGIFIGIDGVPLTKSSGSQFWVIVGYLPFIEDSVPFSVGVYHGKTKPKISNNFLEELVEEAQHLYTTGFSYRGNCYKLKIEAFICDAPARAMIACVKSHSSDRYGCAKCTGFGVILGELRTNDSFRGKNCVDHHHCRSILENLDYVDMIHDLPLDPMHLIDLGVQKKMLTILCGIDSRKRIRGVTLTPVIVEQIDAFLAIIRPFISRLEFARQPRTVKELPRWKSSEYRVILHYVGVVLFRNYLPRNLFNHFLLLHYAVKIFSCEEFCHKNNACADSLLSIFIKQSAVLYDQSFVSYNVHSLFHIASDVLKFGVLENFSAYRFENFYGNMKKYLIKSEKPLQQFVKRQVEEENCKLFSRPSVPAMLPKLKCVEPHNDGPLVQNLVGCQFYTAQIKGIGIIKSRSLADSCVFLSDMSVIEVKNFVIVGDATFVIGHLYKTQQSYSVYPFQSSNICEYLVSELSTELRAYDVYDILYKAVRLPTSLFLDGSFVVFPLRRK